MKGFIVPLLTAVMVVSIIFAGCMPGAPVTPPPVTPPPVTPPPVTAEKCTPLEVKSASPGWNPWEGLAVKPDGTPFRIAYTHITSGFDALAMSEGLNKSLLTRAGAEVDFFNPDGDVGKQIAWIDDIIAVKNVDALYLFPVQEAELVASADRATQAGIPVYVHGIGVPSPNVVTRVRRDLLGECGSNICGEYFVKVVQQTGQKINIFEVWGMRSMLDSINRNVGFHRAVDGNPLITVLESADSNWMDDIAFNLVVDAFTAQPELNGLYVHGGGATAGSIEGLKAVGRLKPIGEPGHVITVMHDIDTRTSQGMDDGEVEACTTHAMPDLDNGAITLMWNNLILGQEVPKEFLPPMYTLTSENYKTLEVWGVLANWVKLPQGQWDLWPVMDFSQLGPAFAVPTVERRMELQGY